ncbi:CHASE domain-containing protein [Donghicola tyrosinivorans]|uniref:histidine kinase n=2 Tax=Donghicola tyrosinivorans TaxID=1652492 RepID=A0A2T0WUA2_9RHOB|nr:CHASE domain-containing protein [Donghicola tyrosinivorans]
MGQSSYGQLQVEENVGARLFLQIGSLVAPLLLLLLAASVLWGWLLEDVLLTHLAITLPGMSTNTAIAFSLSAASLLVLRLTHFRVVSMALALLVAALGALRASEYLFFPDLNVDQWIFGKFNDAARMGELTTVGFILSGVAIAMLIRRQTRFLGVSSILTCAFIVVFTALMGLTDLYFGPGGRDGSISLSAMSPMTSVGFMILMAGVLTELSRTTVKRVATAYDTGIAMLVSLVGTIATLVFWYELERQDRRSLDAELQIEAHFLAKRIGQEMENISESLERFAGRYVAAGSFADTQWRYEARTLLDDFDDLNVIALMDNDFKVTRVEPEAPYQKAIGIGLEFNPVRAATILEAHSSRETRLTSPFEITTGATEEVIFVPMFDGYTFVGMLAATADFSRNFPNWIHPAYAQFDVTVSDGDLPVMQTAAAKGPMSSLFVQADVAVVNRTWTVTLNPDVAFVEASRSRVRIFAVPLGMLLTILVALVINRAIAVSQRNKMLQKSQISLRAREMDLDFLARQLDLVISNTNEGILYLSDQGRVLMANDAATQMFALGHNDLTNLLFRDLKLCDGTGAEISLDLLNCAKQTDDLCVMGKEPKRYYTVSVSQVNRGNAGDNGYVVVLTDTTRRRENQIEREALLARLEKSNAELSQFAYICSHDLQEPLRIIGAFSERLTRHLKESGQLDDKAESYLGFVNDSAHRAQELIRDVLAYSRLDYGEIQNQNVDLNEVIQTIARDVAATDWGREVVFLSDPLPVVQVNKVQIYQVFQNFVGNAIKYAKNEGPVNIRVTCQKQGGGWCFSVSDNGIGIAEKHLTSVFKIFKRLVRSSERPGTGVGLAICKKVVDNHGGQIWVESAVGEGSTFYFTLPVEEKDRDRAA